MSADVSSGLPVTGSVRQQPFILAGDDVRADGEAANTAAVLHLLVLNFRMYGTILSRSNTSPRGGSPGLVSAKTATGLRNGCRDSAQQSLGSARSRSTAAPAQLTRVISAPPTCRSRAASPSNSRCDYPKRAPSASRTSCPSCGPFWQASMSSAITSDDDCRCAGRVSKRSLPSKQCSLPGYVIYRST